MILQSVKRHIAAIAIASGVVCSSAAFAQEAVTLRTPDGSVAITGVITAFDGDVYTISTPLGSLQLNISSVECIGAACPVLEPPKSFAVAGPIELTLALFPQLLKDYAANADVTIVEEIREDSGSILRKMDDGEDVFDVQVLPSSSAAGIAEFIAGDAQVVLSSRALNNDEMISAETDPDDPVRSHVLGLDGLVIVTARSNGLPSVSVQDVADVFAGNLRNWSELGGSDAPITVYVRDVGSDIAEVFNNFVMAPAGVSLSPNVRIVASDAELANFVAADPNAIGFTRYSRLGNVRPLPIRGECGLIMAPNDFSIKTEEYPLTHRLYAFTRTDVPDFLGGLTAYMGSDAAQPSITTTGWLNQNLSRSALDQQGMRFASALRSERVADAIPFLQQMVEEMVVSERLSATYRFNTGSSELDDRAQSDIARAAAELSFDRDKNQIVRVMGFTDSLGDPELNRELSQRRANQVTDALLAYDPTLATTIEFQPMGYGDVSPIACDQNAIGRRINRRVELWVSVAPG